MSQTRGIRMKKPAHPGNFIKHEIFDPLGVSVAEAANTIGVTPATLSAFLNEQTPLSSELAARLATTFGLSTQTLMRMQNSYDTAASHQ